MKLNKKDRIIDFLMILICIIVFSCSLFGDSLSLTSTDALYHINRLVGLKDAFMDHQILPKIYPYTNNGYGYASPLFYCDLFLYPFAIIYYLGVPLILSFKLLYIFYTIVGCLLAYICIKNIFNNKLTYRTIFILFVLGQYRFLDAYTRMALGEYLALCFSPVILLAFYKVLIQKKDSYLLLALGFSSLVLTHNLSFALYCLLYLLLIIIFVIVNRNLNDLKKLVLTTIKGAIVAILLCLWFLLPMLEGLTSHNLWVNHFSSLYRLDKYIVGLETLINPFMTLDIWTSNAYGYVLLLFPLLCFFKKECPRWIKIITIIGYVNVLLSFDIIPIHLLSMFNTIQFCFRFNMIAYPLLALSAGYIVSNYYKILAYVAIVYTLMVSCVYDAELLNFAEKVSNSTAPEQLFDINGIDKDYNEKQISGAEYLPVTEKNNYLVDTTFIKEIKNGLYNDVIYDYSRSFTKIEFEYDCDEEKLLMLPLTYYKGYGAYAIKDGVKTEIEVVDVDIYEKVGIYTLEGNYTYYVYYKGTTIQYVSLAISAISFVLIAMFVIKEKRLTKELK